MKRVTKKARKKIALSIILVLFVLVSTIILRTYSKNKIEIILMSSEYSYLPKEAQNYIKQVYEESGEIVLTEKNKQENVPYLNPSYIDYLTLSEEEKAEVGFIPEVYSIEYIYDENYSDSTMPTKFDLRDVDGNNYLSDMKNQGSLGICWAIASIENAETYLMYTNKQPYNANSNVFSARQMDYATSTDGLIYKYADSTTKYVWKNTENGYRSLTAGGNFYMSSLAMANGITLADETVLPWNEKKTGLYPGEVLDYSKSEYEVNSTIQLPIIDSDTAESNTINNYNTKIKQYILEYGGAFVGTIAPTSTCGFANSDGNAVVKTDDCYSSNLSYAHAMQIIGWDDDYKYAYCDAGTTHYSAENGTCSTGTYTEGKGAWILRNSWGDTNSYKYLYLTYDSTRLSIGFITSMSEMSSRTWDNNYHNNPWNSDTLMNTTLNEDSFVINAVQNEKIEKIKFYAATTNGSYTIYVSTDNTNYTSVKTLTINEPGMYTVDLSDQNIMVSNPGFSVKISGSNRSMSMKQTISVFTSNITETPVIYTYSTSGYDTTKVLSDMNPLYVSGENYYNFSLTLYPRNIPANATVTYRVVSEDTTYNKIATVSNIYFIDGRAGTFFDGSASITYAGGFNIKNNGYGKTLKFEIVYDGNVVSTFPIKFSGNGSVSTSNVRLHANNGTDYYYNKSVTDKTETTLDYVGSSSKFFNNGYYIKNWNTKADGTGTSYAIDEKVYIYRDFDLYAQWSDELLNSIVSYECKYSDTCTGSMSQLTIPYNENITFAKNTYTKEDYVFLYWNENGYASTSTYDYYYEEETYPISTILTYPVFNNTKLNFYAVWSNNYSTITFDSNGGTGTMKSINVEKDRNSKLKRNLYTKDNYTFNGWNTKADGSGDSYYNSGIIKISEDITLYAQWKAPVYTIKFNSNGGTGTMTNQSISANESANLTANTFTKVGYTFNGWNTKGDGTGDSYTNEEVISITENITLYAQWIPITYKVVFDSNGATGTMSEQIITFDETTNLIPNSFSYEGYTFVEWNTKADGTGTSYFNKASVKNLTTENSIILYAIWTDKITYEIKEYTVDNTNNNIDMIPIYTTIDVFKENIILGSNYSVTINLGSKSYIYTGSSTKIYKGNNLIVEYINIVRGDVNGDAKISALDYVKVKNHIMKTNIITDDVYMRAADANLDNKITALDYVRIKNIIMEENK